MTVATRMRARGNLLTPTQLTGLALRVKSDALVLSDSDPVTTWADSSGNSRDFTQATLGNKPLYKTNVYGALPSVRFDGTDDWMQTAAFGTALSQPNTVILVCTLRAYTPSTGGNLIDGRDGAGRHNLYVDAVGAQVFGGAPNFVFPSGTFPTATPLVISLIQNGASSIYRRNGVQIGTGDVGTGVLTGLTLGYNYGTNFAPANMDVAEVCLYNSAPTIGELNAVERYFGAYYGISVT